MELKIKRVADVEMPKPNTDGNAAIDLPSAEDFILKPDEQRTARTGIKMQIPVGFVGLVWDRSGMAAKHSIHTFAGVIDSSYRGEICIVLKNFGSHDFHVTKNMRIAQLVIQPYLQVEITEGELDDTKRGESGFGSSGTH